MSPLLTSTAVAILWVHGLIHLMGAVVYMRLGSIEGLPYKTVLAGRWDVGFVVAGAGLAAGADWWRPMTLVTAALSLVLALIDWPVAFVAVGVDLVVIVLAVASALPVLHG